MNEDNLNGFCRSLGHTHAIINTTSGEIVALHKLMFTHAIVVGITEVGYSHRYCYPDLLQAKGALEDWRKSNFAGEPGGFIVRKGTGGDMPGPLSDSRSGPDM
jgi:hypothetical protein